MEEEGVELIFELLDSPIAFQRPLAKAGGSANAGLFLSQLLYWSKRSNHEGKWIYKNAQEWHSETYQTEGEQRSARKALLERGLIEEDVANKHFDQFDKRDQTKCFRINLKALWKCLCSAKSPAKPVVKPVVNLTTGHVTGTTANAFNPILTTEITAEKTTTTALVVSQVGGGGGDMDELVESARWAAMRAGQTIRSRGGWESSLRARLLKNVSAADQADLDDFRKAKLEPSVEEHQHIALSDGVFSDPDGAIFKIRGNIVTAKQNDGDEAKTFPVALLQHRVNNGLVLSRRIGS